MLLPPETIDYIFSFLDTSALKACSEALPLFSKLAERHLYAHIVIHTNDPPSVFDFYQQFSQNPLLLNHLRVLEFEFHTSFYNLDINTPILSIVSMIPRMTNLRSLGLDSSEYRLHEDFLTTFRGCLQHSSIEHISISSSDGIEFPLSILDNGQIINKLTLYGCEAMEEPISSSDPPQLSLKTLILGGYHDSGLRSWVLRRSTNLKSLVLESLDEDDLDWLSEFLMACPNSLTNLCLDLGDMNRSTYLYQADGHGGHWIASDQEFSFTLSAFTHLKTFTISALVEVTETTIDCVLPSIIRLIKTAPSIQNVGLSFHCCISADITALGQLDWSILHHLHSDPVGARPRITFCITGEGLVGPTFSSEDIFEGLAGSKDLMDLVDRGLVVLKSEPRTWENDPTDSS